jgi:hypothetical protein
MSTTAKVLTGIVLFAALALLLSLSGIFADSYNIPPARGADVMYMVESDGPVEISYNNKTNGMDRESWPDSAHQYYDTWSKSFAPWPDGARPYIAAQSQADGDRRVVVRIFCDGVLAQRSESHGPYTIATATAHCR